MQVGTKRRWLTLALLTLAIFAQGCAAGTSQKNHSNQIQGVLDKYGTRAYRCAPKQLALAESHLRFARVELSEGDFLRAEDHLRVARINSDSLQEIVDRRAAEGDPCEEVVKRVAELDTDGDGIVDKEDACPTEPEDRDGFQDEDGCPDPDNDADGILDTADNCPNEPEDIDGDRDQDGCPDLDGDRDGDGIIDRLDRCPEEPEDRDGFEDEDGCPDPDNDKDGILDAADKCPLVAEDKDGFEDEDGCPDPDNDNDGLPDTTDKCPMEPEDYDGDQDEDGCPDQYKLVVVTQDRIELRQTVYFATNKAVILKRSYPMLNEVAQVLIDRPNIRIRVEGHTDSRGSDSHNMKLSQARADSVRQYLTRQGIDDGRMESVGYGETRPIEDNASKDGRAANRRVEIHIISQ